MIKKRFSKGVRKYIRNEKARIRREVSGVKKQKEFIDSIYQKLVNEKIKSNQ